MLVATSLLVAAFFLGSQLMQRLLGMSALGTGFAFLPVSVGTVAGAHLAGRLLPRVGPRILAAAALIVASGGFALLTGVTAHDSAWRTVVPGLVLAAAGLGAALVTATTTALSTVDEALAGVTSGTVNTAHELGAAVGVATMSAVSGIGAGTLNVDGFTHAYWVASIIAVVAAALLPFLLPRRITVTGRTVFAH
jgi:hypothetical protein